MHLAPRLEPVVEMLRQQREPLLIAWRSGRIIAANVAGAAALGSSVAALEGAQLAGFCVDPSGMADWLDGPRTDVPFPMRAGDGRRIVCDATPIGPDLILLRPSVGPESVERARVLRDALAWPALERGSTSRLERLHIFTRALAQAITPAHVADAIVIMGLSATSATNVGLWLLGNDGATLCLARSAGPNAWRPEDWTAIPLERAPSMAIVDAIRRGVPVWIESSRDLEEQYPEAMRAGGQKGERSLACLPLLSQGRCIGGLVCKYEGARQFVEEDRAFLAVLAWHSAQAIERSRLYAAEKRAREAAEASQRRSDFLVETGTLLASSLDHEATLAAVARAAVPHIADWCVVELEDHLLRQIPPVAAHVDPSKVPLVLELGRRFKALNLEAGLRTVLQTGKSEVHASISVEQLREVLGEDLGALFAETGIVSSMVVPISARGRTLGAIVLNSATQIYDENDVAMAEELGRKAGLALESARLYREAREADRQKDEFLAMLSHELRNPLAPIVTALELMKLRGSDAFGNERAIISRNVKHIVRLVDDLLDVARITRGKIELHREGCELSHVIATAVEMMTPLVEARAQVLTISAPPRGLPVLGDPARLAQAIANLLANANKYTEAGGRIDVAAVAEGSDAVVRVSDSGIGIAPETLPRVFDLFVQDKRALDRTQGGLGIGLTVVKALVELHGGSVSAKSGGLGRGSEFTLRLPLASREALSAPDAGEVPSLDHAAIDGDRLRVLLVDDNADAANVLQESVCALGHEVRVAHDGVSALAAATGFEPDLVLVDIGLPGMDGYELAGHLRRLGTPPRRMVALTGYGRAEDYRRSHEAGFDEHIVKPMDIETLRGVIARSDVVSAEPVAAQAPAAQ
jgi:signal transduction histidine kinase/ActR/RegA family two-component response regulator